MTTQSARTIFISCAHQDRTWLERLLVFLKPLMRELELSAWTDTSKRAGKGRKPEIEKALSESVIAIILVSQDYLASDFVHEFELPSLLARAKQGLSIIWLAVNPTHWENSPLGQFQSAWDPNRPLSLLSESERDAAFLQITRSVNRLVKESLAMPDRGPEEPQVATTLITKVRLRNIRCFDDIELDLEVGGQPCRRTILLGDNATGKTSLLRAIALGLCDESGATALLKKVPGRFARDDASEATIEIELAAGGARHTLRTEIHSKGSSEVVRKEGPDASTQEIFLVGYGTQRTRLGDTSYDRYSSVDAVATLFHDDAALQNPEVVLRRQPLWVREQVGQRMLSILLLDDDEDGGDFEYSGRGIFVSGPWGRRPLEVLSDGYRSTTQWILDFLSWLLYAGQISDLANLSGIVLIDELEQHLHPQWQREIVGRLRDQLPKVQFIASSHSPLIASSIGLIDSPGSPEKLVHLSREDDGRIVAGEPSSLKGMTTDQVLASSAFDYLIQADPEVEEILAEASRLASKGRKRTADEEKRYRKIKRIMTEILKPGDSEIEREVRDELYQGMKKRIAELEATILGGKA